MGLVVVPPVTPSAPLLTLAEAKEALRVTGTDEDVYIAALVAAATRQVERDTDRTLIETEYEWTLDRFPGTRCWWSVFSPTARKREDVLFSPRSPLVEVASIEYYDGDGVQQTLDPSAYLVVTAEEPGQIVPAPNGAGWPTTQERPDAVLVTLTCGYGDAGTDVPETFRQAARLLIVHWFENRGAVVTGTIATTIPKAYDALVGGERLLEVS